MALYMLFHNSMRDVLLIFTLYSSIVCYDALPTVLLNTAPENALLNALSWQVYC